MTWRVTTSHRPGWLLLVLYSWHFFVLALLQVRFTGPLAPFIAIFAGLGFVHIGSWVELWDRPLLMRESDATSGWPDESTSKDSFQLPDWRTVAQIAALFLLIAGFGVVQSAVKMDQIAVDDDIYETATWIDGYATEQGLTYPDTYVFSPWPTNRVYNYFVSSESQSYYLAKSAYAGSMRHSDGSRLYRALASVNRTGFVVIPRRFENATEEMLVTRLYEHYGSRHGEFQGAGHYRLVYVSDSGPTKVFRLVKGARIAGNVGPNTTVSISTQVTVDDVAFTYRRQPEIEPDGEFYVNVPYPGTYQVNNRTVTVSEEDISEGRTIRIVLPSGDGRP